MKLLPVAAIDFCNKIDHFYKGAMPSLRSNWRRDKARLALQKQSAYGRLLQRYPPT
jgi:hypothetical protein